MKLFQKILSGFAYTLICCAIAPSLQSCSDDIDISGGYSSIPEGYLELNFQIPDAQVIETRSDETIKDLTIFIFNSDGDQLYQDKVSFTGVSKDEKKTIKLEGEARKNGLKVYAVANAASKLTGTINSIDDIEKIAITEAISDNDNTGLVMSGVSSVAASATSTTIILNRVAAKITMTLADTYDDDYALAGFEVRQAADGAYIGSPTTTDNNYKYYSTNTTTLSASKSSNKYQSYLYPTKAKDADDGKDVFVLLKATPTGSSSPVYYYKLSIKDKDLDINSNTEYAITIKSIKHVGFLNAADAIKYEEKEEPWVEYEIHDHVANVLSMTTDGLRELGMTYDFEWDAFYPEFYLTVKYYTPIDGENSNGISEYPSNYTFGQSASGAPYFEYPCDWLVITGPEDDTDYSGSHTSDPNDQTVGVAKKYTLKLKYGYNFTGTAEANIKVKWMGLERTCKITYRREFNASHICKVNLFIKKNASSYLSFDSSNRSLTDFDYELYDYWNVLKSGRNDDVTNTSNNSTNSVVKLFGIDDVSMGEGDTRDQGFHFPMPYGDSFEMGSGSSISGSFWHYEYLLDFRDDDCEFGASCEVTNVEFEGSNQRMVAADYGTISNYNLGKNGLVILRSTFTNGFDYWTGKVLITVKSGDDETVVPFNIYHTGFFHHHYDKGYYYYEVVPIDAGGSTKYIFDRNLGAKSRAMYIEGSDGSAIFGDPDAKGEFYTVANKATQEDQNHLVPIMDDGVCPNGYHIPSKTEWDKIKGSENFSLRQRTTDGTRYYTAETESTNTKAGTIYFPKSRFINNSVNSGDAAAGYYWTATASQGLEKDQIGKWLKVLNFNGNASSYINGEVEQYQMSVRCAAGKKADPDVKNTISFKVRGATNVYLYSKEGKVAEFTFPGKAICGPNGSNQWISFSYTCSLDYDDLGVLFAYVTSSGQVTLFTNNEDYTFQKNIGFYDLATAMKNNGWKPQQGYYYDFLKDPSEYTSEKPNVTDGLPSWEGFMNGDKIKLEWYRDYNNSGSFWYVNVKYPDGTDITNGYEAAEYQGGTHPHYKIIEIKKDFVNYIDLLVSSTSGGLSPYYIKFRINYMDIMDNWDGEKYVWTQSGWNPEAKN